MKNLSTTCNRYGTVLAPEDQYEYRSEVMCEDCLLEARMDHKRKTHWQYLTAIKSNYLKKID